MMRPDTIQRQLAKWRARLAAMDPSRYQSERTFRQARTRLLNCIRRFERLANGEKPF